MKVLVVDKFEKAGLDGLKSLGCDLALEPDAGADGVPGAIAKHQPDVLIVRSTKVQAPAFKEASRLKLIVRAGAGVDNIDVPAASAKRVGVCNCPGMNAVAVAELAMLHLLNADRRLVDQTNEIRAGKWNKKEFARGRGLKGSTLGIIGLGSIGRAVAARARAFEMEVYAWDRHFTGQWASAAGVGFGGADRAGLLDMVKKCDAVTVHVALTDETKHMCNAEFFAAMKPGSYFINTSRGGVVDESALRDAVKAKGIRAGLDVFENQPGTPQADFSSDTARLPGVYGSHHCGASTDQAQSAVSAETVRVVKVFKETGTFENCVNTGEIR